MDIFDYFTFAVVLPTIAVTSGIAYWIGRASFRRRAGSMYVRGRTDQSTFDRIAAVVDRSEAPFDDLEQIFAEQIVAAGFDNRPPHPDLSEWDGVERVGYYF